MKNELIESFINSKTLYCELEVFFKLIIRMKLFQLNK